MAPVCPPEGRRAPKTPGAAGKSADQPVLTAGKGEYAMSLFGLRPEEPAAIRIREAATRGTLSHALLLTGSGDRMSAACFAAAALECTGGESRPCGVCPACRKVLAGIHPDVITVRDPDHKNIAVDVVRAIRADAYIRPNEGRRKVYVFPDCALLTEQDQNVLLKVVEEGPPYAAFLFCIRRIWASCSIGWCVGPSSPTRNESCVQI